MGDWGPPSGVKGQPRQGPSLRTDKRALQLLGECYRVVRKDVGVAQPEAPKGKDEPAKKAPAKKEPVKTGPPAKTK